MFALQVLLITLIAIALFGWAIAWLLRDATKDGLEEPIKFKYAFLTARRGELTQESCPNCWNADRLNACVRSNR